MEQSKTSDASGGVPAGWRLVPEEATEAMWQAGAEADEHPADSYSAVYRAMLASAPPAPTPEAGSDLAKLSAAASEGEWKLSGQRMGGDWIIATAERVVANCRPWSMRSEDDRNKQDGAFIVAIVNAYRSGRLIEASPSLPPAEDLAGQGEPVAERVPTGFERLVSKLVTDALYGVDQVPPHIEDAIERLEDALMQLVDADRAASATMEAGAMRLVAEALEHWSATFPKSHDIQGWLKQDIGALNYAREREAAFAELAAPAPSRPADRAGLAQSHYELLRECQAEFKALGCKGLVETIEAKCQRHLALRDAPRLASPMPPKA